MEPNRSQGGGLQKDSQTNSNDAAANILRMQIDSVYDKAAPNQFDNQTNNTQSSRHTAYTAPQVQAQPQANTQLDTRTQTGLRTSTQTQTKPQAHQSNPFNRTHKPATSLSQEDQWKQYHSAWQTYYQKYYERYYEQQKKQQNPFFVNQPQQEAVEIEDISVTKDSALSELRQQLVGKVQKSAQKVKKSRHFKPIAAALIVVVVFSFLQYNRAIFAAVNAYVSPGAISPQNIIVDQSDATDVGPDPKLIIPKINVDVPVIYGIGYDHDSQMKAMENGVAHFAIPGANSRPGQVGNTVLSGHSSNDLFDSGMYKFIFAQLDKMAIGDMIYANYEGTRYSYKVTKKEVVKPTEVSKLTYSTDKPVLTLITCTPLGTALNRLLVTAEQVSPSPTDAKAAPVSSNDESTKSSIPGNSPTLIERIFGSN